MVQVHARSSGAFASQSCCPPSSKPMSTALWAMLRVARSEAPGTQWSALDTDVMAVRASSPAQEANLQGVCASAGTLTAARLQRQLQPQQHVRTSAAAQVILPPSGELLLRRPWVCANSSPAQIAAECASM